MKFIKYSYHITFVICIAWLLLANAQFFEKPDAIWLEQSVHFFETHIALGFLICLLGVNIRFFLPLLSIVESGDAYRLFKRNLFQYALFSIASFSFAVSIILIATSQMPSVFKGYLVVNSYFQTNLPDIETRIDAVMFLLAYIFDQITLGLVTFTGWPVSSSRALESITPQASLFGFSMWLFNVSYILIIANVFAAAFEKLSSTWLRRFWDY